MHAAISIAAAAMFIAEPLLCDALPAWALGLMLVELIGVAVAELSVVAEVAA
jgi:hypothetical protein